MISNEDIQKMLTEIMHFEKKMEHVYTQLFNEVKDKELKKTFEQLVQDEKDHEKLVEQLLNILKSQPS